MNTTNFESSSAPDLTKKPGLLQMILVEPLLVVATGAFWLLALPLVGASLACVKIWDAFIALNSSPGGAPNPLFLRRGRQPDDAPAFASPTEIWASSHI